MERKHACERKPLRRIAGPAVALLAVFLSSCEPQQETERDRELDEFAGGWLIDRDVFDPFAEDADWVENARFSVKYHRERNDLISARGTVIKQLNSLKRNETASASDIAEFESLLVSLDREILQIPVEELRGLIDRDGIHSTGYRKIAYLYEISRRPGENADRGLATADLCRELVARQPSHEKTLTYCDEAFDILATSPNPESQKRLREVFSLLNILWQDRKWPLHTFPYTERMIPHFEPSEVELQLGLLTFSHSRKVQSFHGSLEPEEEAREIARLRYLMAKELGNKRAMGLALWAQGASWERQGSYAEAGEAYDEARSLLASVGYLEVSPPLAALFDAFDRKHTEADLRVAVTEAEAKSDLAAVASVHEAVALLLIRQERIKEVEEAHRLMLKAARESGDKTLIANALVLMSSHITNAGDRPESVNMLSEAAQLYRELGDVDSEASVLLILAGGGSLGALNHHAGADIDNLAVHQARAFALLPSVTDVRLKAMLHQMKALQDQNDGDFASMRVNGTHCRDYWASLGAREQIAHCEIVIAEAEIQAGDNDAACGHLAAAERIFADLGMPGRAAMQTGKAEKLGCAG